MEKSTFRIRLGQEIAKNRVRKDWSQRALAKHSNLSISYIQNLEYAWARTTIRNLAKVCRALDLSIVKVLTSVGTEDAHK